MFAAGRVVTGVGGAGMRSLVSSLIVRKYPNHGSYPRLHVAKLSVPDKTLSNVCRSGSTARNRGMAIVAQV